MSLPIHCILIYATSRMDRKLVVVFGATGLQGGGVVTKLLENPSYRLRGVTRNSGGEAAKALIAKGVDVVGADLNDYNSVLEAVDVGAQFCVMYCIVH